ncbi:unnamed protein product [Gordionus sp. m RMFG-2023]|uniref:SUMO-activating enzyme subunit 1-like n=1 Tax=Gordionus sp. m RMFG-2023 TaxID=3053472 RepID=UPI0030E451A7
MLNEEEIDIYDRQIRIWGHDVQKKIKNYSIMLIGFSGLGWEISKNLILYGIKTLCIMDNKTVTHNDLKSNLYLKEDDIGNNRAECSISSLKYLNPNVQIIVETKFPDNFHSANIYKDFDLVIMNDVSYKIAQDINNYVHQIGKKCIYTRNFFLYGYIIYDFGSFQYNIPQKPNEITQETNNSNINFIKYPSFSNLLINSEFNDKIFSLKKSGNLKKTYVIIKAILELEESESKADKCAKINGNSSVKMLQSLNTRIATSLKPFDLEDSNVPDFRKYPLTEFNPVCAVLAGFLCQELIKILSSSKPSGNLMLYDGSVFEADTLQLTN